MDDTASEWEHLHLLLFLICMFCRTRHGGLVSSSWTDKMLKRFAGRPFASPLEWNPPRSSQTGSELDPSGGRRVTDGTASNEGGERRDSPREGVCMTSPLTHTHCSTHTQAVRSSPEWLREAAVRRRRVHGLSATWAPAALTRRRGS